MKEESEATDEEEERGGVVDGINNLSIETVGTEEDASEIFMAVQEMEAEEEREDSVEGVEGGVGTQGALGVLELLTQDANRGRTDKTRNLKKMPKLIVFCLNHLM